MLTDFLIRAFVKDHQNTKDKNVRQAYGYLVGIVGIIANVILFGAKFVIGYMVNSIAVMADAINNMSDASSSVVTLIGFKITNKPADREHPFGHGRAEYITALIVSFMVVLVGFEFIKSSIERIRNPEPLRFDIMTFSILVLSIAVKVWISGFNKKIGKAINSKAMEATALDSISDVITTSVVAASLLASRWITFPIDGYVGVIVALFIMYSGFNLTKETFDPLIGEAPPPELVKEITKRVLSYESVIGVHDIIIHNYGPGRSVVSLHAELPHDIDIMKAHDIIDLAEREISQDMEMHIVIHMDPISSDDEVVERTKKQILEVIYEFSEDLSIHDFRVVGEGEKKNVIFDLVVPHDVNNRREKELGEEVKNAIRKKYPGYNAVITMDREYSILR